MKKLTLRNLFKDKKKTSLDLLAQEIITAIRLTVSGVFYNEFPSNNLAPLYGGQFAVIMANFLIDTDNAFKGKTDKALALKSNIAQLAICLYVQEMSTKNEKLFIDVLFQFENQVGDVLNKCHEKGFDFKSSLIGAVTAGCFNYSKLEEQNYELVEKTYTFAYEIMELAMQKADI